MPDTISSHEPFCVLGLDGHILYCNREFALVIGEETTAPILGTAIDDWLIPPDNGDRAPWLRMEDPAEGYLRRKHSEVRYRFRLAPLLRDRNAEGAVLYLREDDPNLALDQLHARAFHLNPGLSAITVLESGKHLDVNDAWLTAMEYRREEVIGRTADEMKIWGEDDGAREQVVGELRTTGRIRNRVARMRTKTGNWHDVIVSAETVVHRGQELAFFASHDITDVRRAQAELTRLNQELEQRVLARTAAIEAKNQELAEATLKAEEANQAKSRFLSMMSHEIRTPLNAVINMVDLLMEADRNETDRRYLEVMVTASKSLLAIVNDILDFSRIEANRLDLVAVETDVEEILEEVVHGLAPLAHDKGLDIALTVSPNLPATTLLDSARLRQILMNLAENAVKYTRSGWVHIEGDLLPQGEGKALVFDIVDTGIGIDPADQEKIFERFTRVTDGGEETAGGTGLGLSIVAGLAHAMGGEISVSSQRGQGSAFRLILPVTTFSRPKSLTCASDVVLLGPESRTRETLAATLAGLGGVIHVINEPRIADAASWPNVNAALIVLPITPLAEEAVFEWCRLAEAMSKRVVLLAPVGRPLPEAERLIARGMTVSTYPMGRQGIAGLLSGEKAPARSDFTGSSLAGVRVLAVDDTEVNRQTVEWGLASVGAIVTLAKSGNEALALAAKHPFDLILLDLRMPEMDGYETAARLHALEEPPSRPPILAISATVTPDTLSRVRAAGMDGYLAKPFHPDELRQMVMRFANTRHDRTASELPAEKTTSPAPVVLDQSFLSDETEFVGTEAIRGVVERFIERMREYPKALEGTGTDEERAEIFHRLAGAAGALGLLQLADLCRREEARSRSELETTPGRPTEIEFRKVLAASEQALRAFLKSMRN